MGYQVSAGCLHHMKWAHMSSVAIAMTRCPRPQEAASNAFANAGAQCIAMHGDLSGQRWAGMNKSHHVRQFKTFKFEQQRVRRNPRIFAIGEKKNK